MTKYAEIAELATAASERFWTGRSECRHAGFRLATEFAAYLAAPEGAVTTVALDRDMRATGTPDPLAAWPEVVMGDDGFWYFGLQVHFEVSKRRHFHDVILKMGLRPGGKSGMIARWEHDHEVGTERERQALFETIARELLADYSDPKIGRRRRPGFID